MSPLMHRAIHYYFSKFLVEHYDRPVGLKCTFKDLKGWWFLRVPMINYSFQVLIFCFFINGMFALVKVNILFAPLRDIVIDTLLMESTSVTDLKTPKWINSLVHLICQ